MENTTLKTQVKFAEQNGYLVAAYKKATWNGVYNLLTYDVKAFDTIPSDTIVATRPMLGPYTDYKVSNFGDYAFVLHNTYNLPNTRNCCDLAV